MSREYDGEKIKILIVEDEPLIAMNLQAEFIRRGYNAYKIISNGEDAVATVQDDPPDIILMDILLIGHLNGIETANKIRKFSNTPIIFMTGYSDEEIRQKAKKVDPVALIDKPVPISDVAELIDSTLSK